MQTDVLEYGGLDMLWALVKSDQESEIVQKRALFGVGSLLRRNPGAQHVFVAKHNGFDVLARKFLGSSPQFQLRAVTLVTDLVSEEVRSHTICLNDIILMESFDSKREGLLKGGHNPLTL